jgi:hypothetical protein
MESILFGAGSTGAVKARRPRMLSSLTKYVNQDDQYINQKNQSFGGSPYPSGGENPCDRCECSAESQEPEQEGQSPVDLSSW